MGQDYYYKPGGLLCMFDMTEESATDDLASTTAPENVIFLRVQNLTTTRTDYMGPFYDKTSADDFAKQLRADIDGDCYQIDYYSLSPVGNSRNE